MGSSGRDFDAGSIFHRLAGKKTVGKRRQWFHIAQPRHKAMGLQRRMMWQCHVFRQCSGAGTGNRVTVECQCQQQATGQTREKRPKGHVDPVHRQAVTAAWQIFGNVDHGHKRMIPMIHTAVVHTAVVHTAMIHVAMVHPTVIHITVINAGMSMGL